MDWAKGIKLHLKMSYDNVKILTSKMEADPTNSILKDMFSSQSISFTTNDNMRVAKSVQEVMVTLYREVAKQDHILDGTLFGVGSFWDGTRVVKAPNEFVICMFSVV